MIEKPRRQLREKGVERDVIGALETMGFNVTKTSRPGKSNGMTPGIPDLYASHPRWQLRLWVEVKAGDNTPSLHQRAWHANERAAGGTVLVVWSVSDLLVGLTDLGCPVTGTARSGLQPPRLSRVG